ncbi:betaine-aldehyde dehydrogenase [Fluviispira multicolorata]|uniref:Betaine-aldehyde dehydrogenase n=1 Tax=Fluviispira multicolorata TaxID=2654512 RepID=A0A833JE38_9BACT|nr:betaine-aldehyde dehydrogenase [Fluviispira multicolorata]KAB8032203.1 betaine-aldehyde dehydrogenase [Fluviispira multicolorata]
MQKYFSNYSPSTGNKICEIEITSEQALDNIIRKAQSAFKIWSRMSGLERGKILNKAARIIRERSFEIAQLEVLDSGKPITEALEVDVPTSADALEYFAGIAPSVQGEHIQLGKSFAYTRREPLGICAGIGAWNYPFQIACWKSAPALACGNVMIFKPSELTPMNANKLEQIYLEAGVPEGVFQVVQGGREVGEMLSLHPEIRKISLTGSIPTGKRIMENSAKSLKHVSLELGGKSPLIIFDDFDFDRASSIAILANFYTQGEICCNGTRVFVHKKIKEKFIESLLSKVEKIKVGDPFDSNTQMGSLISKQHLQRVLSYIESGKEEGATLLCGGTQPEWSPSQIKFANGNFILPTVFTNCHDEMKIVKEEIFGPVMSILEFEDENEVIQRANNTEYGLAAGVLTHNIKRAHRVIENLQAGMCWINNYNISPVEVPFGGMKGSGFGRENGLAAIECYTQLKTVYVEMDD